MAGSKVHIPSQALPSGVTAGTYGSATQSAVVAVNEQGQITSASNATISGVAPGGAAAGDLGGTYPSPTVQGLKGDALPAETGLQLIQRNEANSAWVSLVPQLSSHFSNGTPGALSETMAWVAPQASVITGATVLARSAWTIAAFDTVTVTLRKQPANVVVASRIFGIADAPTAAAPSDLTLTLNTSDLHFADGDFLTLELVPTGAALPGATVYQWDYTPIGV